LLDAQKHGAVCSVAPCIDTILYSEDGKIITSILCRQNTYHLHCPEAFNLKLIKSVIDQLTENERNTMTSNSQICMLKGIPVFMTPGDNKNIKITTDFDMSIAPYIAP
jgi:2-C-methyl-D-erythritol 4-phosphate cytidylyltransferase